VIKMEIENEIEVPPTDEEKPAKKTRARKAATSKKQKLPNPAEGLLKALKFVSVCQKKVGEQQTQFCIIANKWIAASNEVLTVATPILEDLECNAHTYQLIDALSKVQGDLSVVSLSESCLSVKSGDFTGLVSCLPDGIITVDAPDATCALVSDSLKHALMVTATLTTENAPSEYLAGVLLQANSAVGTDSAAMIEYWHGIDLPSMLIPRASALAVAKCDKPLVGFGYSGTTATFWFEDGSFIKTRLFENKYPNYKIALDVEGINAWPLPEGLFQAVKLLEPFCSTGNVYFNEGFIYSDELESQASTYKLEGVPNDTAFNIKRFLNVLPHATSAHFYKEMQRFFFFGTNLRGVLMECGKPKKPVNNSPATEEERRFGQQHYKSDIEDDDIPF